MIVRIVFMSSFLFYCLLLKHSFPTNPNRITNCLKLILFLFTTFTKLHLLNAFRLFLIFFEKQIHRPLRVGTKQITIHLVDLDTKELVAGWLVTTSSAAPVVSRTYDVDVTVGKSAHKKIAYVNKWDRARNFRYV